MPPPLEPFGLGVNRSLYVPRPASEHVLERVEALLASGRSLVALTGPTGIGKTMLVRVLVDRLREHASVILLPYPRLSAPELCAWALRLMGEPAGRDPERRVALRAMEERSSGSALVLVIDGAESMLLPAARRLGDLARSSEGALRVLAAVTDGSHSGFVLDALGADLERVEFAEPMNAEETARYVEARLAAARAPDVVRARFDAATLSLLHAHSRGIPRRLHELATAVVHGDETPAAETDGASLPPVPRAPRLEPEADAIGPEPETDATYAAQALEEVATDAPLDAAAGEQRPESARDEPPHDRVAAQASSVATAAPGPDAAPPIARAPAERARKRSRRRPKASYLEAVGVVVLVAIAAIAIPLITPRIAREMAAASPAPNVSAPREAAPAAALAPAAAESGAPPATQAGRLDVARAPTGAAPPEPGAPAEPAPIAVNVNAIPWAEIEVDGRPVGVTPLADLALAPGPHRFVARLPDGRTLVRVVEIGPEQRHLVFDANAPAAPEPEAESAAVAPAAPELEVSVNAVPWAEIWIDDQPVGITPLAGLPLAPGRHRFRARMPDGRTLEREIEIGPERRHVSFE